MPKYNLMYISPSWHSELKDYLEIVGTDSEIKEYRGYAKALLDRMDYMGVERSFDQGTPAQLVITDGERRFLLSLTKVLKMEEAHEEFSHFRSSKRS